MKTKLFTVVLIALTLFSCKDEKKEDNNEAVAEKPKNENLFKIAFDAVVAKDDSFHLYYTEDKTNNFTEDKSVWVKVKGSDKEQEVLFMLPEDVLPTDVRVDFGYGDVVQDIVLKRLRMNYYDKSFVAQDAQIFNYFYANEQNTLIDKNTNTIKRLKADQKTAPSLYPQILLQDEMIKMVK